MALRSIRNRRCSGKILPHGIAALLHFLARIMQRTNLKNEICHLVDSEHKALI